MSSFMYLKQNNTTSLKQDILVSSKARLLGWSYTEAIVECDYTPFPKILQENMANNKQIIEMTRNINFFYNGCINIRISKKGCITNNCCCTHLQSKGIMCSKIHLDKLEKGWSSQKQTFGNRSPTNGLQCLQNILPKFPYLYISLYSVTLPNRQYKLLVQAINESNSSWNTYQYSRGSRQGLSETDHTHVIWVLLQ